MSVLHELFTCTWQHVESSSCGLTGPEIIAGHPSDTAPLRNSKLSAFPVSRFLGPALTAADNSGLGELSNLLRRASAFLHWSQNESYTEPKVSRHFLDNYVTGVLTGLEADFGRDVPVSGFVLLGPHTEYPRHSHAPAEVYFVLTPGTKWRLGDEEWFTVEPGQFIQHSPWQSHTMRTDAAPMLAFAAWLEDGDRRAITI